MELLVLFTQVRSPSSQPSGLVLRSTFVLAFPLVILPPTSWMCCFKTCWVQPANINRQHQQHLQLTEEPQNSQQP